MRGSLLRFKRSFLTLVLLVSTGSLCVAGDKETAALQLLNQSFQHADLWKGGPVRLNARVSVPLPGKPDVEMEYTLLWAAPDAWRTEWRGGGYSQIMVVKDGIRHVYANSPIPPLSLLYFETALGALDGFNAAGPFSPAIKSSKNKVEVSSKKIDGAEVRCMDNPDIVGKFCFDAGTGRAVRNYRNTYSFSYGDYAQIGQADFPQTIRVKNENPLLRNPTLQAEGKITITRDVPIPSDAFAAPPGSRDTAFPWCAELEKNTVLPALNTKVPPSYPQAARMSHQAGTVSIYLNVTPQGRIDNATVFGSVGQELNDAALAAVRQWTYTPYQRCGVAVDFETFVAVNFSLAP